MHPDELLLLTMGGVSLLINCSLYFSGRSSGYHGWDGKSYLKIKNLENEISFQLKAINRH